ncbi:DsbA family protein [Thiohalomonas denitrificans]|uniref:Thioredoxin n=1 Tax=Thiohalomonas denitrificans TaxID=415747 RepID=A0A1G5QR47_9GAMM|nr:thioredoxin domain-containing protein [Thiohalomonas denitrificans]SCZ64058.1 Thioredoxin [Thiohalomonas denitrificans]
MKQKTLFIIAFASLVLAFVFGALIYTAEKNQESSQRAEANPSSLVRMHSPTLGPAGAPVVIVEFLDPACGTCRTFYPAVKEMLADNPDQIRLVLRYAPFHQGSDQVVALMEAARRQGQFWPVLETLLANQNQWVQNHTAQIARVWPLVEGLGLDRDKLQADMASPEVAAVVAQDLEDAQTLNVTKTPEFFVNGKPLPSFGYQQLKDLVDNALSEARSR